MKRALFWIIGWALIGCGSVHPSATGTTGEPTLVSGTAGEDGTPTPRPGRLMNANRVHDYDTWSQLASRPRNHTVARTEVVKFLIDLEDDNRAWFINTDRWNVHYQFALQFLSTEEHPVAPGAEGHRQFNIEEYRRDDRRFVCGSLTHYIDPDLWTFEMIAGDNLPGERVLAAFEQIRGLVYFGDQLHYRAISELHEQLVVGPLGTRLPTVTAEHVFAGIRYQPLTQGDAYGTLRFVRGPLDLASVRPDQILVLEQLPDEIPVVGGVISQQLQAPLGHVAVLCATRRTPNAGLREALRDERLVPLENQLVHLTVGAQELSIEPATREAAEAAWEELRPRTPQTPRINAADTGLPELCTLGIGDAETVGAKAAQLGEACQIGGVIRTPGGFAIPFYQYIRHLEQSGAGRGITGMLADENFQQRADIRDTRLAELRAIIQQTPVDPRFLRTLRRRLRQFPGNPRVIFRSSTNAEDLAGFTGAGLYRSIVVSSRASDREIADAVREVWASVWLLGAHEERDWFRIDHARVAMGILVQPFVDGASSNGVAITANPFYEARPGYFVNAQALGGSVTGASGDEIPEQHLIYTYSEDIETELISRSSRNNGAVLLRDAEIRELATVLETLAEHFEPHWEANAIEVEFLVAGDDREIIVLQVRPFDVVYHEGQRERD